MAEFSVKAGGPRHRQYDFAEFTLDLESGFLRRGGDDVALRPKSFEVLTYLVERHGRLVSKSDLIEAVWPDTAVSDNSLAQCLAEIRRALGDDSQQVIRTVARRGYFFAVPVTTAPVRFTRVAGDAPGVNLVGEIETARHTSRRWTAAAAAGVVLAVAVGGL